MDQITAYLATIGILALALFIAFAPFSTSSRPTAKDKTSDNTTDTASDDTEDENLLTEKERQLINNIAARNYLLHVHCTDLTITPSAKRWDIVHFTYRLDDGFFTDVIKVTPTLEAVFLDYAQRTLVQGRWNVTRTNNTINATPPAVTKPNLNSRKHAA